jgi:pectate lyase
MKSESCDSFSRPFRIAWMLGALLLSPTAAGLSESAKVRAFPGAEGFGKFAQGGRGGEVYHVTNLGDSGPGSLRHGLENAKAPRTIVFEVSGTIALKSPLRVDEKRYLTIAGQSSPGTGITLRDQNFSIKNSKHIVVRYLRVRLGDENKEPGSGPDVMTVDYNDHVILDHLSLSWGIDGNSDYRGNSNVTLQWLIYSEALNASLHGKGEHAMCSSLRDCLGNTTVHHNIYSTSRNRHPTLGSGVTKGGANWIVDFRNCVNYNWSGTTNLGGLKMNVVGNYYRPGPCTKDLSVQPLRMKDHDTSQAKGFAKGNFFHSLPEEFNRDNFTAVNYTNTGNYMSTSRERWELRAEIDCGEFAVPTESAQDAYERCLRFSGCSLVRDTVDERIIANIIQQTGEIIDSQNDVGGWDRYPKERRPEGWDRDRDGMPDAWEMSHNLDPNDPEDRNSDADRDGYTNLEDYLNSLCSRPGK